MRHWVLHRLWEMQRRPTDWARTREAFIAQVSLLLEVAGHKDDPTYPKLLKEKGDDIVGFPTPIDSAFATEVVDEAIRLLTEEPSPSV